MKAFNKIIKALIYPHMAIVILLCPVAAVMLVLAFAVMPDNAAVNYVSYVLSAYALTVVCFRIPEMIKRIRSFSADNKYASRLKGDAQLKVKLSLGGTLAYNAVYAMFQLVLGIIGGSAWYYSLAAYYFLLSVMKVCLLNHTARYVPGEKMFREVLIYRMCGIGLVMMNLALPIVIAYLTRQSRSSFNDQIVTIALAAFTFTSVTIAIVNVVKYRKYQSPVFSASKAITLASALVSLITLEDAMLATFGGNEGDGFRRLMVAFTGLGITALILAIGVVMIVRSTKSIKKFGNKNPLQ